MVFQAMYKSVKLYVMQGCACFPEFLQHFSERQILWSFVLGSFSCFNIEIAYSNFTFCDPKLPVSLRSGEKCQNFRKKPSWDSSVGRASGLPDLTL